MATNIFWIGAGLLCFAVGAMLLRALRMGPADDAAPHLTVYRDQLAEVDRDLARDVISSDEAARLRTEVSRRLLDASKIAPEAAQKFGNAVTPKLAIFAAISGAIALYFTLGVPDYPDLPLHKRLDMAAAAYENRPAQAEAEAAMPAQLPQQIDPALLDLITQLRAVVAQRPDDIQGLILLARNESALGNYSAAAQAYRQLIAAKGGRGSLDDHLAAAQTMIAATGGMVSAEAEAQLTVVLELDPENGLARYFLGLMFAQTGRPDRAFTLWEPLTREGKMDALYTNPIRAMLPDLAEAAGIKYTPPSLPGPTAQDVENAADMSATDRQEMIQTMVTGLEARLLSDGGTLDEWQRLITALGVMNDPDRQMQARDAARKAYANDPAALQSLDALP
jgi:cytochrome c-type biogenesis protein CcmH